METSRKQEQVKNQANLSCFICMHHSKIFLQQSAANLWT